MAADIYIAKSNFTSGQWSPDLAGRIDLPQFNNAVKRMFNFLSVPHGGAKTRPGTVFVARAKYNDRTTRLIPFEFNVEQAYVLEFGDGYIRFFANNARVEGESRTITNATDQGQVRITSASHGFSNGDFVAIRNVIGTYEANDDWEIANVTTDTFDLLTSDYEHVYDSGGTARKIIEIASPYAEEDLAELKVTQSADVMYIFHRDYPTYKLTRTGATTFTITAVDWEITPFLTENVTATTLDPNGTTVGSSVTLEANTSVFESEDVGRYMRVANGVLKITAVTNGTHVTATIKKTCVDSPTNNWAFGAWCEEEGFPAAGIFYENRLVTGGSSGKPQTIWGSKSGQPENFDMSNTDDEYGWSYDLASKQANVIRWMAADDLLLIGTSGREFKVTGGNDSGITPTNVFARPQSRHGSFDTEPVETTSGVVFLQRAGRKVRALSFDINKDRYVAPDLSILSNRIAINGFISLCYQAEPNEVIWLVRNDGTFASLTLLSEQNIVAWAGHETDGAVQSMAVVSTNSVDQAWMCVIREINEEDKQYIEYLDPEILVDSAVKTTFGNSVSTVTGGLAHLEGVTVEVLGDGARYNQQVVTGAALPDTFDPELTELVVGIPVPTPTLQLFEPHKELQDGSTVGRKIKVVRTILRVDDTLGMSVNDDINPVRSTFDEMDTPVDPETDDLLFTPDLDWGQEVVITQHLPFPAHVLGAYMFVEVGDD